MDDSSCSWEHEMGPTSSELGGMLRGRGKRKYWLMVGWWIEVGMG